MYRIVLQLSDKINVSSNRVFLSTQLYFKFGFLVAWNQWRESKTNIRTNSNPPFTTQALVQALPTQATTPFLSELWENAKVDEYIRGAIMSSCKL